MELFCEIMDLVGTPVDAAGVSITVVGAFFAIARFFLGLEFLVAGDIVRTLVVLLPSITSSSSASSC